jgi:hypothetical protein
MALFQPFLHRRPVLDTGPRFSFAADSPKSI